MPSFGEPPWWGFSTLWPVYVAITVAAYVWLARFLARRTSRLATTGWLIVLVDVTALILMGLLATTPDACDIDPRSLNCVDPIGPGATFGIIVIGFWAFVLNVALGVVGLVVRSHTPSGSPSESQGTTTARGV